MLYGIITLLKEDSNPKIFQAWKELREACDLPDVNLAAVPHLTWHIAENYELPGLKDRLSGWAAERRPFRVQAAGLGLFTGPEPVVYVPVLKSSHLARFHQKLIKQILPLSIGPSRYYSPAAWTPHITLAFGMIEQEQLGCTVQTLAYRTIQIEFWVDHFALGFNDIEENWGIKEIIPFKPNKP